MIYYAGIGSRKTPSEVLTAFEYLGTEFAKRGYVLHSGAADGADSAFERGCDSVAGPKEIFLPWQGFQGRGENRDENRNTYCHYENAGDAIKIAKKYHPNWDTLSNGGRALMARNSYQVLGKDLQTPSSFVVCWTEDGKGGGGTGQALRIAKDYGIKVCDFGKFPKEQAFAVANKLLNTLTPEYLSELSKTSKPVTNQEVVLTNSLQDTVQIIGEEYGLVNDYNSMLEFQAALSERYKYKKLKPELSEKVRTLYEQELPEYFKNLENRGLPLTTADGVQIARKWDRVVVGDYGAFVEISDEDIIKENIHIPAKQLCRVNDPQYSEHVKYLWYEPTTGCPAKLYCQLKTVTYADYQAGKWYISPYETAQAYEKENAQELTRESEKEERE